jgi:hypothetical protein
MNELLLSDICYLHLQEVCIALPLCIGHSTPTNIFNTGRSGLYIHSRDSLDLSLLISPVYFHFSL